MSLSIEEKDGEIHIYNLFEGGGGLIRCRVDGVIELYEIPSYGGEERYRGVYPTIQDAIKESRSWT